VPKTFRQRAGWEASVLRRAEESILTPLKICQMLRIVNIIV
jgi:hypothetical protein